MRNFGKARGLWEYEMMQSAVLQRNVSAPAPRRDLGALILKLRWMGMDHEADRLCRQLEADRDGSCMPIMPGETD